MTRCFDCDKANKAALVSKSEILKEIQMRMLYASNDAIEAIALQVGMYVEHQHDDKFEHELVKGFKDDYTN